MKMDKDSIVTAITSLIGVCTLLFGLSQDVAEVLKGAVPTVVGGVMSIVAVVTYLVNRRKGKEAVLNAVVASNSMVSPNAKAAKRDVMDVAREIGLI